jgi:hypothetical protein
LIVERVTDPTVRGFIDGNAIETNALIESRQFS